MPIKNSQENIIGRFIKTHNDRYDYSLVEYQGMKKKVKIICKKHGEFYQTVQHHIDGRGCTACNKGYVWTDYERQFVKDNYISKGSKYCAEHLKQGTKRIARLGNYLGLSKARIPFVIHPEIPRYFWSSLISNAQRRNIEIDIDCEYIWRLFLKQNKKCALTGWDIKINQKCSRNTASLDRIDSSKGYIEGNVQWLHKIVNKNKMDSKEIDFYKLCKDLYNYRKKDFEDEWSDTLVEALDDYNDTIIINGHRNLKNIDFNNIFQS